MGQRSGVGLEFGGGGVGGVVPAIRSDNGQPAVFATAAARDAYAATASGLVDVARIEVSQLIDVQEVFVVGSLDANGEWTGDPAAYAYVDGVWTITTANLRGIKGDRGNQGIQGIQGIQGDQGDQGIQGVPGPAQTPEAVRQIVADLFTNGNHNGITYTSRITDDPAAIDSDISGVQPPMTPAGSVSNFSIDVPPVSPLNADLNGVRMVTFTTTNTADISSLTLTGLGDDVSVLVPTSDGTHTVAVTVTGVDTSSITLFNIRLEGQRAGGQAITSNIQTATVRDSQEHEMAYVWAAATQNFATQDLTDSSVQSFDVSQPGTQFSVTLDSVPDTHYINIIYPDNRPITSIIEPPLNLESLSEFPESEAVRTIGSQTYNGRSNQNNSGISVQFSANITVGG